jgi:Domain of unknown function (DUF1905)/Bacteriocin-protection, YdeI or OmpD-Associated
MNIKDKCQAKIIKIGDITLLRIPSILSSQLPSRGLVMVNVDINQYQFKAALEPDGKKGHWLMLDAKVLKAIKVKVGDEVNISVEVTKDWIEPNIPQDLDQELKHDKEILRLWGLITPAARWEWIRWINATKNVDTRNKRIQVGFDKLRKGSKRPCCFNGTECTFTSVSKNGILLESEDI